MMLIGLNPVLGPDLLHALRAMGHGDTIVLADANFPAASVARRLIRADGADLPSLLTAVLSVLPIDEMEPEPAIGMEVVGDPARREPVHRDIERLLSRHGQPSTSLALIERHAFYERARSAFAVVASGERRVLRQHHPAQGCRGALTPVFRTASVSLAQNHERARRSRSGRP